MRYPDAGTASSPQVKPAPGTFLEGTIKRPAATIAVPLSLNCTTIAEVRQTTGHDFGGREAPRGDVRRAPVRLGQHGSWICKEPFPGTAVLQRIRLGRIVVTELLAPPVSGKVRS